MSRDLLECIEITTAEPVQHSVIWLHGLGATADDFVPVIPELGIPDGLGVRFVFPQAPTRPITINNGYAMPGWYDITSLDFTKREQDVAGTQESAAHINRLIDREIERGVPASQIVLAGFSQGGAVALYTGLISHHRTAGILALSTYLPLDEQIFDDMRQRAEPTDDRSSLPIFFAHGTHDDVILLTYAEQSKQKLLEQNFSVEWSTWPMPHSVIPEEIKAMGQWLKARWGI